MALKGYIKNLFIDKEKTVPLFPKTKIKAVSDDDGTGLNVILNDIKTQISQLGGGGIDFSDGAKVLKQLFAAGKTILSPYQYGKDLPEGAEEGEVFFQEATGTIADIGQDVAKALRAVNLLDNSDFRNPVNQRGNTAYNVAGYTIDRWRTQNTELTLRIDMGYAWLSNANTTTRYYFQQHTEIVAKVGKTYTLACYDRTNGKIYAFPVQVPDVGGYNDAGDIANGTLRLNNENEKLVVNIMVNASSIARMEWIALYEGEYTVETLPPYAPNGYALEMVKSNGGATAISKVWENASPNGSFAAQTVSLDLADAQLVAIVHKGATNGTVDLITFVEMNKKTQTISQANAGGGSSTVTYVRTVDVTPTGVAFAKGITKQIGSTSVSEDNSKCIPLRIYAIKGVQ